MITWNLSSRYLACAWIALSVGSVAAIGSRGQCPLGRIAVHVIAYACTLVRRRPLQVTHTPSQAAHNRLFVPCTAPDGHLYWWHQHRPYAMDSIATALFCVCTFVCANTSRVQGDGSILLAIASISVSSTSLRGVLSVISICMARWVYLPDMWSCARAFSLASSVWLCRFDIHWGVVTLLMCAWWAYVYTVYPACSHVFDAVPDALPAIVAVLLFRCSPCLMLCVMSCVV